MYTKVIKSKIFKGIPVIEIRQNLDLRKMLGVTKIFPKSRFGCTVNYFSLVLPWDCTSSDS